MADERDVSGSPAALPSARTGAQLQSQLVTTRAKAMKGDKQALAFLAKAIADREARAEFDDKTQAKLLTKSFDALQQSARHLGKTEFDALVIGLEEPIIAAQVEDLISSCARGGNAAAMNALRAAIRRGGRLAEICVNVMAQVRSQLIEADYQLIGRFGLRYVGDCPAYALIAETSQEGKPASLKVLRETLLAPEDAEGDPMHHYAQVRAATLLAAVPEHIDAELLPSLVRLASTGKPDDRVPIFEAVAELAVAEDCPPGAAAAFVEIHAAIPPKASFDAYEGLRAVSRRHGLEAFEAAEERGDLEAMTALAPLVLRRTRDPELAVTAAELLYPAVMAGEARALGALAETASQPAAGGQGEACQLAVKMLEAAAQDGQAEAVVDALLEEIGKPGKNDDERALEALGRAARHLPRTHPRIKKVRAALRKAVKMFHPMRTRGHMSALRGMLVIADRLREKDTSALIDNLGPQAGKVLAAAAEHMKAERLVELRDTLHERVRKKINVKGARAALQVIEKLAPQADADSSARSEATMVVPRRRAKAGLKSGARAGLKSGAKAGLKTDGKSLAELLQDTQAEDTGKD